MRPRRGVDKMLEQRLLGPRRFDARLEVVAEIGNLPAIILNMEVVRTHNDDLISSLCANGIDVRPCALAYNRDGRGMDSEGSSNDQRSL